MAEDNETPTKKGRDPILLVGAIVLVLAFAVVISGYAYGEFVSSDSKEPAKFGSTVKVDYIGSYYGWYDEDGAVVFDTSKWSIANDDDIAKSWEFSKRDEKQYVPFSVTIGSGGALMDFENILIGMKIGETVRIEIPEAYGAIPAAAVREWDMTMPLSQTETMSAETYKLVFGLDNNILPGPQPDARHPYGWMSGAFCDSNGVVTVTHRVTEDPTDDNNVYWNADKSMSSTVTNISGDFFITFDFPDYVEGRLIEFVNNGQKFFITDIDETAGTFKTKNTDEKTGMTLFFVITVVGFE
ncbi:MAG: FKBP-type peptidyl-prolyl cis-trans isomerase [Methanomassiliicoccaceae archaeon]|jgi:hypothetical protein|nr:FKBP-type peptidyl-prolyl cis-trans isomerase [Methanomassiliicoccaceae archaeon]